MPGTANENERAHATNLKLVGIDSPSMRTALLRNDFEPIAKGIGKVAMGFSIER